MWRKLRFIHMTDVENWSCLHMMDVEQFHISPHDRCWEYELSPHNRWGEFHHLLIYQINNVYNLRCFYVYYAVLLQNLFILQFTLFCRKIRFCRDLRAFAWRKIEPKIVPVEKKGQISCMGVVVVVVVRGALSCIDTVKASLAWADLNWQMSAADLYWRMVVILQRSKFWRRRKKISPGKGKYTAGDFAPSLVSAPSTGAPFR